MLRKKLVSAILSAGFLAAFAVTPAMADVSTSGTVGFTIESNDSGMTIGLDEAELKFKSKGEADGIKLSAELELEIKDSSTFDLEEASVKMDMGTIYIMGGILEEGGSPVGGVVDEADGADAADDGDENPGLRVGFNLMDGLDLDVTLQMSGDDSQTLIQAAYDLGVGTVMVAVDSATISSVSTSSTHVGFMGDFGAIKPFVGMTTLADESNETIIGLDYVISEKLSVGAEIVSIESASTTYLGVLYDMAPVEIYGLLESNDSSSTISATVTYYF